MVESPEPPRWAVERPALAGIALFSVALALFVAVPYLQYVLFGGVLAYVLYPAQRRLEAFVRPSIAAFSLVVLAVLAIVAPLVYVLQVALRQSAQLVAAVQNGDVDVETIERELAAAGYEVDLATLYESYQGYITSGIERAASGAIDVVGGLPRLAIGLTVTLFVCFALLRDGDLLVDWLYRVTPVDDEIQRELFTRLDRLMQASVVGNVVVAAVQAVMLGAGLFVLGLPAVVLLTVLTFVLTLLPLVGAFGVWLPASIYLVAVGRTVAAAGLFVYGLFVTLSDTYLRPALIGQSSAFNSAIVVVGIFGGLIAFGAVGLFVGPVAVGSAKITLDLLARARIEERGEAELES